MVGEEDAPHYGALLFSSAYGMAELEISGYLTREEWRTTAQDLVGTRVAMTARHHPPKRYRPLLTVRSRIPSVARRADSGMMGKRSWMSPDTFDQS